MDGFTLNETASRQLPDEHTITDMQEKVIELIEDIYKPRISQVAWHKLCVYAAERVEFHAGKIYTPWTVMRLTFIDIFTNNQFPKETQ